MADTAAGLPESGTELRSTVRSDGTLELSLVEVPVRAPAADEVLIRVEATPINPSDLGLLFAGVDMSGASASGTADRPIVTTSISPAVLRGLAARVDQSLPVGNEGAGTVIATGESEAARALLGRTVAAIPGGMYAQYRCAKVAMCLPLPVGATATEGASCFVNPLTALAMTEVLRRENHTALVHTAAASNLGQMLVKICLADDIPLVNVVRRAEQAELLRSLGATHVCDSSRETFAEELTEAIAATGATLAFDATGGGSLADRILAAMEAAARRKTTGYSPYGSTTHKQIYIYGALDRSPTVLERTYGLYWSVSGWLLVPFLARIGFEAGARLRARVADELRTTFASHYGRQISLREALTLDAIAVYGKQSTGDKYLICPQT